MAKPARTNVLMMLALISLFSWSCEAKEKVEEPGLLQAVRWLGLEIRHPEQLEALAPNVQLPSSPLQAHAECGDGWAQYSAHLRGWPIARANLFVTLVTRQDEVVLVSLHPRGWQEDKRDARDRTLRTYPDVARNHWAKNCETTTSKDGSSVWRCAGYSVAVEYVGEQALDPFESSPEWRLARLRTPARLVETAQADGAYGYNILLFRNRDTLTQWFQLLHRMHTARRDHPEPEHVLTPCAW